MRIIGKRPFIVLVSMLTILFFGKVVVAETTSPEQLVKLFYPESVEVDSLTGIRSEVSPCLMCYVYDTATSDKKALYQTFTDPLASFFIRVAEAEDEDPINHCIDFDPVADGQDAAITEFNIAPAQVDGSHATVAASFLNFDRPTKIIFHLEKHGGAWKVDDIEGEWYRLKEYISKC